MSVRADSCSAAILVLSGAATGAALVAIAVSLFYPHDMLDVKASNIISWVITVGVALFIGHLLRERIDNHHKRREVAEEIVRSMEDSLGWIQDKVDLGLKGPSPGMRKQMLSRINSMQSSLGLLEECDSVGPDMTVHLKELEGHIKEYWKVLFAEDAALVPEFTQDETAEIDHAAQNLRGAFVKFKMALFS